MLVVSPLVFTDLVSGWGDVLFLYGRASSVGASVGERGPREGEDRVCCPVILFGDSEEYLVVCAVVNAAKGEIVWFWEPWWGEQYFVNAGDRRNACVCGVVEVCVALAFTVRRTKVVGESGVLF